MYKINISTVLTTLNSQKYKILLLNIITSKGNNNKHFKIAISPAFKFL